MSDNETTSNNLHRKAWEVLQCTELVDAWPWLRVYQDHVRLPNSVEMDDFYRVEMPPYIKVFALTPANEVVMVEHYKHGPGVVSLELPAGGIEEGDTPLGAAQRELLEETGMVASDWLALGRYFIDGNRGCGAVHGFLATDTTYQRPPRLEAAEIMQTRLVALSDMRKMWLDGTIGNVAAVAIIGLALAHLANE
jgi:8-oxo-dGTP pyrophosphatase MutT (NUDIX family)